MNNNWYMLCDTERNIAIDFFQLPEVWKDIPDMHTLTDEQLATIGEWSEVKGFSLLPINDARANDINTDSIDTVFSICYTDYLNWLRVLRDSLLNQTDVFTVSDRWDTFDAVQQRNIKNYRQALRDLPKTAMYGETWPEIPAELDFLRKTVINPALRPSQFFIDCLKRDPAVPTQKQILTDQLLRIQAELEKRQSGGVAITVGEETHWFWTDMVSRGRYALLINSAERNNATVDTVLTQWRTMQGIYIPFTLGMLYNVIDLGILNEEKLFFAAELHRTNLKASEDPASYDYKTGWPLTYEEFAKQQGLPYDAAEFVYASKKTMELPAD